MSTFAEVRSYDRDFVTPISEMKRKKKGKEDKTGGKQDDITVIVGQIKF